MQHQGRTDSPSIIPAASNHTSRAALSPAQSIKSSHLLQTPTLLAPAHMDDARPSRLLLLLPALLLLLGLILVLRLLLLCALIPVSLVS